MAFKTLGAMQVVEQAVRFGALILFIPFLSFGIVGVLLAQVVAEGVTLLAFTPAAARVFEGVRAAPIPTVRDFIVSHRAFAAFALYLNTISQGVRVWAVKFFLGTEAVGLMQVALGLLSHTLSILPLSGIIEPFVARAKETPARLTRIIRAGARYQLYLNVGIAACVTLVGFLAFPTLFPEYAPAVPLYALLAPVVIPSAFLATASPAFAAFLAQRDVFNAVARRTALTCILLPLFIPLLGLPAVALEFFIVSSFHAIDRLRSLSQLVPEFSLSYKDFFAVTDDDRLLAREVAGRLRQYIRQ